VNKVKPGLGAGLDSLIPQDVIDDAVKVDLPREGQVSLIDVDKLQPSDAQPRQNMDESALGELAASIKQHGIIQPIVATENGDKYDIIAGERRWRAARIAEIKEVPVIIRSFTQQAQLETALLENLQREDLTPLEAAMGFDRLVGEHNVEVKDLAKRLGKGESTIRNMLRLLKLPTTAKQTLQSGKISEGHARTILSLDGNETAQLQLLSSIIQHKWSVHQAEQYAKEMKSGSKDAVKAMTRVATENVHTKQLATKLGTKVYTRKLAKGGRLIIEYGNDEQLEAIIDELS